MRSSMFSDEEYEGDKNYTVSSYLYMMVRGGRYSIIIVFVDGRVCGCRYCGPMGVGPGRHQCCRMYQGKTSNRDRTRCLENDDHVGYIQVWIPMCDRGQWRLACVDLRARTISTYDPLGREGPAGDSPSHYRVLLKVVAPDSVESERWTHSYAECPTTKSMLQTGVRILRYLECELRRIPISIDMVRHSGPLRTYGMGMLSKWIVYLYRCQGIRDSCAPRSHNWGEERTTRWERRSECCVGAWEGSGISARNYAQSTW